MLVVVENNVASYFSGHGVHDLVKAVQLHAWRLQFHDNSYVV